MILKGLFEFKPLEPGFGQTVGNSLASRIAFFSGRLSRSVRRCGLPALTTSLPRSVVSLQDVVDIVLNLKQVRLKQVDGRTMIFLQEKIYLTITGKEEFRAGDIEEHTNIFEVMNKDLLICNMEPFCEP